MNNSNVFRFQIVIKMIKTLKINDFVLVKRSNGKFSPISNEEINSNSVFYKVLFKNVKLLTNSKRKLLSAGQMKMGKISAKLLGNWKSIPFRNLPGFVISMHGTCWSWFLCLQFLTFFLNQLRFVQKNCFLIIYCFYLYELFLVTKRVSKK